MKTLIVGTLLSLAISSGGSFAQEPKKEDKLAPEKKADAMKCCEGMEKIGEMKGEMRAKMEKMKEKMAEKMSEKAGKAPTKESKDEKAPPAKDAHQH